MNRDLPAFELVVEHGRPVAALIRDIEPFTANQIKMVYSLLPNSANCKSDWTLAERWSRDVVACLPEWAAEQKRRIPMTAPRDNVFKITIE